MTPLSEKIENLLPQDDTQLLTARNLYHPWKLTLLYGVFGVLWILSSDKILDFLVKDILVYQRIQLYKGWFFIALTSFLFYSFASLNNNRVLNLNLKLQAKNEELWAATEELVAMHDSLEVTIAERTRELTMAHDELAIAIQQESIHQVVRDLLHRFNTPLGNAITYTDLLSSDCSNSATANPNLSENCAVLNSIRSNHKQIVLVMNTLKNMLEIDRSEKPSVINLAEVIPVILYDTFNFSLELSKTMLDLEYPPDDLYLPEKNLKIALVSLSQFAKRQRENKEELFPASLKITRTDAGLHLHYQDSTLSDIASLDEIIDPYAYNSFKTTNAGMELSILYNCVTSGLAGTFSINASGNEPSLDIKIPFIIPHQIN